MTDCQEFLDKVMEVWKRAPDKIKQRGTRFSFAVVELSKGIELHLNLSELLCTNKMPDWKSISSATVNSKLERRVAADSSDVIKNPVNILKALINQSGFNENDIKAEQAVRSIVDKLLVYSTISSFVFVVAEVSLLYNVWESIKESKNVTKPPSSRHVKISEALEKILVMIEELNESIEEILVEKAQKKVRITALWQIDGIRSLSHEVEMNLRNLKVEADRKRVRLDDSKRSSKAAMVPHLVTGGTTAASLFSFGKTASPYLLGFGSVLSVANVILAAFNLAPYVIPEENVEIRQNELEEIVELERQRRTMTTLFDKDAIALGNLLKN